MNVPTSATLCPNEGSLLATALCGHIIRSERLPAVVIKGPIATRWGLRPQRPSADVDVLTDARGERVMLRVLGARGWRLRPTDSSEIVASHSSTLYHPSWNVDVDVHSWYPGFEGETDAVLHEILLTAVIENVAGVDVPAAGKTAMAVIQMLHALRSPWLRQSQTDLAHLLASPSLPDFDALVEFADRTGATGALRPFLESAYGDRLAGRALAEPSAAWTERLGESVPGLLRWRAIQRARGWRRVSLVYRAVIPSRDTMASRDIQLASSGAARYWLAVWRRLFAFLRWLATSRRQR
ncbi:hypothetical protein [Sinomonas sp. P47F7]|uniref:hypothetical protein n=1 Tax=Sinomonas sp. P47F7 TaxID=3410987 RepID=UPI003BF4DD96